MTLDLTKKLVRNVCTTNQTLLSQTSSLLSTSTRQRRDARACLQMRPSKTVCGREEVAFIDILGRAVRVYNQWWTICALCGVVMRWQPGLFVGSYPCCLKCDSMMIMADNAVGYVKAPNVVTACRFCGKPSDFSHGTSHKTYVAPLDVHENNADLPAPLREITFCLTHQRSWLQSALR